MSTAGVRADVGRRAERRSNGGSGAFRPDIQGLRAVAVVVVALNHAGVSWMPGGYVGVDVFFVISGFLITRMLLADARRGSVHFGRFYARRARRILPAASLVIVVTCVVAVRVMDFVDARRVLIDGVWASLFVANVRFSHQGTNYFVHTATSPLQHYWSLAVEEQFYVVWPLVIALTLFVFSAMRRHRGGVHSARTRPVPVEWVAVPLTVIFGVSLALSVIQSNSNSTSPYFSTVDRAWELATGALLSLAMPLVARLPVAVRTLASWAGVAAIAVAAATFSSSTPFPGSAALVPVLGAAAVVAGGTGAPWFGANRVLGLRPFRFVGDISYSLYLWHFPFLILGAAWVGHTLSTTRNLELLVAAFATSVVSYRLIEDPIRKSQRLWGGRPRLALVMWPSSFAVIGTVVLLAWPAGLSGTDYSSTSAFENLSVAAQVVQSVRAAQSKTAIPADLSPSISDVATSFKSLGACSGYEKFTNRICQYGDPSGKETAVVFGNSHSTMWVPALSPIFTDAHWQFFPVVKEACGFPDLAGGEVECSDWYQWALGQIKALHPELILIGGDYAEKSWQPALTKVIQTMKTVAPEVALIELPPGLSEPPTECLAAPGANLGSCLFSESTAAQNADAEEKTIFNQAGAQVIATRSWFCSGDLCPTVVGSIVTYADVGHITDVYARHLIPVLGAELLPSMRAGSD